jgi:hypothetical protein
VTLTFTSDSDSSIAFPMAVIIFRESALCAAGRSMVIVAMPPDRVDLIMYA